MTVSSDQRPCSVTPPVEDRAPAAVRRLQRLVESGAPGLLEWDRPGPSAAFGRLDQLQPGFAAAVARVTDAGFTPFVRPVGGRLAAYHDGAVVLDLLLRDPDPPSGTTARFRALAQLIQIGLTRLGVDARVGRVIGEYCPGDWSVNAGGTRKLVGTGQRLTREAVLLTAVIVVVDAAPLRDVMAGAYADLGLDLDPGTVGSVADVVPGVMVDDVVEVLAATLADHLQLAEPQLAGGRALLAPWTPR